MNSNRFGEITSRYASLRVAVVGDFCLDRYLEIDPSRRETSIETGLPVHNVVRVRAQPGGAGTILGNLVALGVGEIFAIGFCGDDGEGYELRRELARRANVSLDHFLTTHARHTFTYAKPLLIEPGQVPVELNRLDTKNWTATPPAIEQRLAGSLREVFPNVDAVVVLDQVDVAETGVVTRNLLSVIAELAASHPRVTVIADSRRGLRGWPSLIFKMNANELVALREDPAITTLDEIAGAASKLAQHNGQPVFVTLAERGMIAASSDGTTALTESLPIRGPIDIVGAGDSVTANLATALAAGANLGEAAELASIAASIVIHQVGTTGAASVRDLAAFLDSAPSGRS